MSELDSESREARIDSPQNRRGMVAIVAIIAGAIVALACIASTTVILYAFFQNTPW